MIKIVVINGTGGSGKDTFVDFCMEHITDKENYMIHNVSSVDKIKEAAIVLGWNGAKTEKDRKFLSDLKILTEEYNDGNFKYMLERYNQMKLADSIEMKGILFLHIREPKEIQRIVDTFAKNKVITLLITSNRVKDIKSNMADAGVYDYEYNITLHNDGTLEQLQEAAKSFIDSILD